MLDGNMIDVRDIIERVEALEGERDDFEPDPTLPAADWPTVYPDDAAELAALEGLLDELCGQGGDHEWRGAWYPLTLIADHYFQTYARELAEEIGAIPDDDSWPGSYIDWGAAADALQQDYSCTDYDGRTYYYR